MNFKAIEASVTEFSSIEWDSLEDIKHPSAKKIFAEFEQKFFLTSDDT